ncbi:MAG: hypothetical protein IPN13_15200 [Bacteroidetes bacterium]|nr:hypothetical protein [Bacteroidota bacterium]
MEFKSGERINRSVKKPGILAFSAMMLSPNGTSFQFDFENDLLPLVLSPEKRKIYSSFSKPFITSLNMPGRKCNGIVEE